ncbi:Uncharacterised protein [uncultured archaeon]|nr:Uncharacterised protein [uncultured archaeon]
MRLEYIGQTPGEAFIAITSEELSLEEFTELIKEEYHKYSKLDVYKHKENGHGEIYILGTKPKSPSLEIIKIGSEKSRYFCIDKSDVFNQEEFTDFQRFLNKTITRSEVSQTL